VEAGLLTGQPHLGALRDELDAGPGVEAPLGSRPIEVVLDCRRAEVGKLSRLDGIPNVKVAPFKGRCAYRDTAEVSVYLSPEHTGHGLGGQALTYAVDHGRATGLHALLAVICTENTASLTLFERAGFTEVGRLREVGRKFGRLLDVAYLQRILT